MHHLVNMARLRKATVSSHRKAMANSRPKAMANSHHRVTVLHLVSNPLKAMVLLHKATANSHPHQVSTVSNDRLKVVPADIQVNNSTANRRQVAGTRSGSMYQNPTVWNVSQMRARYGI